MTRMERLSSHRDSIRLVGIGFGLVALLLTAVSWFRQEGKWPIIIAFTFGLAAVAWKYFVIAFGVVFLLGFFGYTPDSWFSPHFSVRHAKVQHSRKIEV